MSSRKQIKFDSPLEGALYMAKRGAKVFPLLPNSKDPFETDKCKAETHGCKKKWLQLCGGIHRATSKEETIKAWNVICPGINFGVGASDGVILDLDMKDGKNGLGDLKFFDPVPKTFTVETPTGGQHRYFKGEPTGQRDLSDGINIRSAGGYVVSPGSRINGVSYTILDNSPPAPLPDNIRAKLAAPKERHADAGEWWCEPDNPLDVARGVDYLKRLKDVPTGFRNIEGFKAACKLRDLGISTDVRFTLMAEHWPADLDDNELLKVCENADKSAQLPAGVDSYEQFGRDFEDIFTDGWLEANGFIPPVILSYKTPAESAREFIKKRCTRGGFRALYRLDGQFLSYTGTHYEPISDERVQGLIWSFLDQSKKFDKEGNVVTFDPKTTSVQDVFNAVKAETQLKADALPCASAC